MSTDFIPADNRAPWYVRLLVEWACLVMDGEEFSAFLNKYGLAINERLQVVRK